jgi:hypothetical protein
VGSSQVLRANKKETTFSHVDPFHLFPTYLRQSTIVPDVSLVRETVAYKPKFALLDVLFQWIHLFPRCNLYMDKVEMSGCVCLVNVHLRTSSLALVHRGISTTMFMIICSLLAYKGMSWNGDISCPFCPIGKQMRRAKKKKTIHKHTHTYGYRYGSQ